MSNEVARTSLYMNKQEYEKIKAYCASKGMTVNGLIKVLLDRYMREFNTEESK